MDDRRHPSSQGRPIPSLSSGHMRAKSSKEASATDKKELVVQPTTTSANATDSPKKTNGKVKQAFHDYFKHKNRCNSAASPSQRSIVSGVSVASGASSTASLLFTLKGCSSDLVIQNRLRKPSARAPHLSGTDSVAKKDMEKLATASYGGNPTKPTKLSSQCKARARVKHSRLPKRSTAPGAPGTLVPDKRHKGGMRAVSVILEVDETALGTHAQKDARTSQVCKQRVKERKVCQAEKQSQHVEPSAIAIASNNHNADSGSKQSTEGVFKESSLIPDNKVLEAFCVPVRTKSPPNKGIFTITCKGNKVEAATTKSSHPGLALCTAPTTATTGLNVPVVVTCERNDEAAVTPQSSHTGIVTGDFKSTIQSSPNNFDCRPVSAAPLDNQNKSGVAELANTDQTIFSDDTATDSTTFDDTVSTEATTNAVQLEPVSETANEDSPIPISIPTHLDVPDHPGHAKEATSARFYCCTTPNLTHNAKNAPTELTGIVNRRDSEQRSKVQTPEAFLSPSPDSGFEGGQQASFTFKIVHLGPAGESRCTEIAKSNVTAEVTNDDTADDAAILFIHPQVMLISAVFPVFRPESSSKDVMNTRKRMARQLASPTLDSQEKQTLGSMSQKPSSQNIDSAKAPDANANRRVWFINGNTPRRGNKRAAH